MVGSSQEEQGYLIQLQAQWNECCPVLLCSLCAEKKVPPLKVALGRPVSWRSSQILVKECGGYILRIGYREFLEMAYGLRVNSGRFSGEGIDEQIGK